MTVIKPSYKEEGSRCWGALGSSVKVFRLWSSAAIQKKVFWPLHLTSKWLLHNFELMQNFEEWLQFAQMARLGQGIIRGRKCRLSTETPDYQLAWADLAAIRLLDNQNAIIILRMENSTNLTYYISLRILTINGQSTVPPLCSCLAGSKIEWYVFHF